MGIVYEMAQQVRLPRMVKIRQHFDTTYIKDAYAEALKELDQKKIRSTIKPGMRIAITGSSRGIDRQRDLLKAVVDFVKQQGAEPFIVPAMGSHGGATAEGQVRLLEAYGINEEYCGCPIRATMDTVKIWQMPDGHDVLIDRYAAEADGIIVFGRVKLHSHFRGRYGSGLLKMMVIGLGKQQGAESAHDTGIEHLAEIVEDFGNAVRLHSNVLFGFATVENAYDKCCMLRALTNEEIPEIEPELLDYAKKRTPKILLPEGDVLVIDHIGKNFSGYGQDPDVSGSYPDPEMVGGFQKQRLVFLDMSHETHNNAVGLGAADFITRRLFDACDHEQAYANVLTAITPQEYKIPIIAENQKDAIGIAVRMCVGIDRDNARIVRIPNTLHLDEIYISEALLEQAKEHPEITILSDPEPFKFDDDGNLF